MTQKHSGGWAVASTLLFFLLAVVYGVRLYQARPQEDRVSDAQWAGQSYRDVVHYPARAVADGVNPYNSTTDDADDYMNRYPVADHFPLYSAVVLFGFWPLTSMPVVTSIGAYYLLTLVTLLLFVWMAFKSLGIRVGWSVVMLTSSLFLLSQVGRSAVNSGQLSIYLSLACVGMLTATRTPGLGSIWYVLALAKPTFGGPLALTLAGRFPKSVGYGLVVGGISFLLAGAAVFAMTDGLNLENVISVVRGNLDHFHDDPVVITSKNFARVEVAALIDYVFQVECPGWLSLGIALVMIALTAWAVVQNRRADGDHGKLPFVATPAGSLCVVAMYSCYYHNVYDLSLLLIPILAIFFWRQTGFSGVGRGSRWSLLVLLLVPFLNVFHKEPLREKAIAFFHNSELANTIFTLIQRASAAATAGSLLLAWILLLALCVRRSRDL